MKIEKIHITSIDDSLPYLSPTRTIEIKTNKGTIFTPNRCATSYEFNRKQELPTATTIDNPVTTYTKRLTGKEVKDLLTTNTEYGKLLDSIEKVDRVTEYSTLHLPSIQVYATASKGPSPKQILAEGENLTKFLTMIIGMQDEAKHDIISIPHLDLPISELKIMLKNAKSSIEKLGKQPLFSLDMKYEKFPEVLAYITNDLQSNIINLIYRKKRDVPLHYLTLKDYARKDIMFVMSDVDRNDSSNSELSTMHYLPFLGNDLYSILQPAPAILKPEDRNKPKNIENLKVLDTRDLTVNPLLKKTVTVETIINEIDSKEEKQLRTILENITEARTDNQKYKVVNALTRVHELKSSTKEFSKLHKHVSEGSSKDYVKSKDNFDDRLKKI